MHMNGVKAIPIDPRVAPLTGGLAFASQEACMKVPLQGAEAACVSHASRLQTTADSVNISAVRDESFVERKLGSVAMAGKTIIVPGDALLTPLADAR